jgi:hypothetical protein
VIEAIALLALIWAIAVTLFCFRLAAKLGRAVNGWAATLIELAAANDREHGRDAIIERWEELYAELVAKIVAAGPDRTVISPDNPPVPPRNLPN